MAHAFEEITALDNRRHTYAFGKSEEESWSSLHQDELGYCGSNKACAEQSSGEGWVQREQLCSPEPVSDNSTASPL